MKREHNTATATECSEFDDYARLYQPSGLKLPLASIGGEQEEFFRHKVDWLDAWLNTEKCELQDHTKILDFGTGTGLLLQRLWERSPRGHLEGCDPSSEMVRRGTAAWTAKFGASSLPKFTVIQERGKLPYDTDAFDLVLASGVLHHIPHARHCETFEEIHRILRPGGRWVMFEHNPYNVMTRYVVAKSPWDKDAKLLHPHGAQRQLRKCGFQKVGLHFVLFVPPRWKVCRGVDKRCSRIPLGAQFIAVGQKSPLSKNASSLE